MEIYKYNNGSIIKTDYELEISKEDSKCLICFDDYKENDELLVFFCYGKHAHHLHHICGKDWLKVSKTCPICRTKVNF